MGAAEPHLRGVVRPLAFGVFEFHPETLELKRGGQPVRLQELPARLLSALLRNPGELVTREQLQTELWPSNTFVQFDAGLNTAMNKLRLALQAVPLAVLPAPATGPAVEAAPAIEPPPRRAPMWPWIVLAGVLVVCATLLFLVAPSRHARSGPPVRFAIDLPAGQEFRFYSGRQIAISPDGSTIAWIATSSPVPQIYVPQPQKPDSPPLPAPYP